MVILVYNAIMALLAVVLAVSIRRHAAVRLLLLAEGLFLFLGVVSAVAVCLLLDRQGFLVIQLSAWLVFLQLPLLNGLVALFLLFRHPAGTVAAGLTLLLAGVAVDGFLLEPRWLEVSQRTLSSSRLEEPVRVVLVADFQTDRIGDYERSVLDRAVKAEPDLVLFTGDYLQPDTRDGLSALVGPFQQALRAADPHPRLGAYAVSGDIEYPGWPRIFQDTWVEPWEHSRTEDLGPLTLTGLSVEDSRSHRPPIPEAENYHVVFGHSPDYALARPPAQLLLAGHTHGGQVALPGFGPLLTLSRVPRDWASGHTPLTGGTHLVVSRGTGLEREHAPRIRLWCRPELAILDLVPTGPS